MMADNNESKYMFCPSLCLNEFLTLFAATCGLQWSDFQLFYITFKTKEKLKSDIFCNGFFDSSMHFQDC